MTPSTGHDDEWLWRIGAKVIIHLGNSDYAIIKDISDSAHFGQTQFQFQDTSDPNQILGNFWPVYGGLYINTETIID